MNIPTTSQTSQVYDSLRRGPVALEEVRGLIQYRDLLYQLVRRDLVARYKRSVLGIAWTMLNPLGMMVILSLVFSQVFRTVGAYPAYVLTGIVVWNFFSQTTAAAMNQMVWGSTLLHRIYLPRTSFVVAAIGTGVVNLLLSLAPLFLVLLVVGMPPRWTIAFLPVSILLLAAFSLGVGLLFSAWAIYFPDVAEMYQIGLQALYFCTPIIIPEEMIPNAYRYWFFHLNPMYYMVEIFRMPVYDGALPSARFLLASTVIALMTLALGWFVFSSRADEFTYRV